MTLRMLAVAVWRSSAARSRFFSRAVPDWGLSVCRLPGFGLGDFGLRDLGLRDLGLRDFGRVDWMAVDWGLRGFARLGAVARVFAFRPRVAIFPFPAIVGHLQTSALTGGMSGHLPIAEVRRPHPA